MRFEEILLDATPFFLSKNFAIAERYNNYIRYESQVTSLSISFNERENTLIIFVGIKGKQMTELSQKVLNEFFSENIILEDNKSFSKNLIHFLLHKGNAIINDDLNILTKLEAFNSKLAKEYTDAIIRAQNLRGRPK